MKYLCFGNCHSPSDSDDWGLVSEITGLRGGRSEPSSLPDSTPPPTTGVGLFTRVSPNNRLTRLPPSSQFYYKWRATQIHILSNLYLVAGFQDGFFQLEHIDLGLIKIPESQDFEDLRLNVSIEFNSVSIFTNKSTFWQCLSLTVKSKKIKENEAAARAFSASACNEQWAGNQVLIRFSRQKFSSFQNVFARILSCICLNF